MKITVPRPPSVNNLYGTSRYGGKYIKEAGVNWFEEAGWEVRRQVYDVLVGDVKVDIKFFCSGTGDADNILKAALDLLTKQGVIGDDRQVVDIHVRKYQVHKKDEQKLEIEIDEIL